MNAPIDMVLNGLTWEPVVRDIQPTDDLPYVTHEGVFDFAGNKLRCYRLSNGKNVFNAEDFDKFLGMLNP